MAAPRKRTAPRRRTAASPRRAPAPRPGTVRQLWLAGLGAAVASTELALGAVDGLVARGRRAEPKTRALAEQVVGEVRGNAARLARRAADESKRAVDRTLKQLGVSDRPREKNVLHRLGDLAEALL